MEMSNEAPTGDGRDRTLNNSEQLADFKAGVHLNVVFPPLNMDLIEIARSRFEQYKNCLRILLLYV